MLPFGLIILAVLSQTQAITVRPENSLIGPLIPGGQNLAFWDFAGSAELQGDHVRLTPDVPDRQGAIWNTFPMISNSWEYQVAFHIHGKGAHLYGDGMAFWYVQEKDMLHNGPVFGSKDYFTGLGVFIDTFENNDKPHKKEHRHPYISAMVNNGSIHYEHDEDGTMTQIGGCHVLVRNLEVPTRLAISYGDNTLSVYIDNQGLGHWLLCFRTEGVHLPSGYYFGITASTHESSDNHDVIAVTGLNMDPENAVWVDTVDVIPKVENVHIPLKYHKEFIEEELQKLEKRDVGEEEDDADEGGEEKEEEGGEEESEAAEPPKPEEDDAPPPTSLLRKAIYITGAAVLLLIAISMFKSYNEKRKVRIQKRLY